MALIFHDKFTEVSGVVLTSHTPTDLGTGWTREVNASTGQPEALSTDQLRWSTNIAGGAAVSAQPNPTTADVDVEMTITNLTTANGDYAFGIFGRWADSNNYYGIQILPAVRATVDTRLFKRVGGTFTVLASVSADVGWVVGDVLKLELRGSTIKVYRNGSEILSASDSALTAAGKAGVLWGTMTPNGTTVGNPWYGDDFKVTEVASATPIGQPVETDSALGFSRSKAKGLGINAESDSAMGMGRAKQYQMGMVSELDGALAFGKAKQIQIGIAAESDSALGMGRAKRYQMGLATESDSALGMTRGTVIRGTIGMATESESALGMLAVRVRGVYDVPMRDVWFDVPERREQYDVPARDVSFEVK